MIDKIPESTGKPTVVYSPIVKQKKQSGAFMDVFLICVTVVIFLAVVASYFVIVDVDAKFDWRQMTVDVVWLAAGTFCIGALSKKYTLSRGRKTDEYKTAKETAKQKINELCKAPCVDEVTDYCEAYTERAVYVFRHHTLSIVGLELEDYNKKYIAKSGKYLFKLVRQKEITWEQFKAIRKCNKLKIKPYDTTFLLSYEADLKITHSPSEMYNVEALNTSDTIKSIILTILSSLFIGRLFSSVILNATPEAVFECVIKVISILINVAFKATLGWNFALMEQKRNNLRASETEACIEWCKRHPKEKTAPVVDTEAKHEKEEPEEVKADTANTEPVPDIICLPANVAN